MNYEEWLNYQTTRIADSRVARVNDKGHLVFIGSTGSGKTTLMEINIKSTLKYPQKRFDVFNSFIFDPQNELLPALVGMKLPLKIIPTNVMDERSYVWEMWKDVVDPAGAMQFAFNCLPDEKDSNTNKFYNDAPRFVFAGVVGELVNRKQPWTMRQAFYFSMFDHYAKQLITKSDNPGVQMISRLFSKEQGSTKANIDSSLLAKLGDLQIYAALMEHAKRRFCLSDMLKSDVVMHIGGDFEFPHIVESKNYLLLTSIKRKLVGQEKSDNRRHYIYVDEFSALNGVKPADEFLDFFERGRSRGVRIAIGIQTPAQLFARYGEALAAVILGQTQQRVLLRIDDIPGSEFCSKMLGSFHGYEWTHSITNGFTRGRESSVNWGMTGTEHYVDRPYVHPDVLRNLPLASFEQGIHGYLILPNKFGVDRRRFFLSPEWLAEHAVKRDERVRSYESSRRRGEHQKLAGLTRTELDHFNLEPDPDHPVP